MNTHDVVLDVLEDAGIDTYGHALAAVRATVHTLASCSLEIELLMRETVPGLVPETIALRRPTAARSLPRFYEVVAAREGRSCSLPEVRRHVRATTTALAACGDVLPRVADLLPPIYTPLFAPTARDVSASRLPEVSPMAPAPSPVVPMVPRQR